MQGCAAGYTLTYMTTLKQQFVTWTVVGLNAAKFKRFIFPRHGFSLSSTRGMARVSFYADACLSAIGYQWPPLLVPPFRLSAIMSTTLNVEITGTFYLFAAVQTVAVASCGRRCRRMCEYWVGNCVQWSRRGLVWGISSAFIWREWGKR
jgi:hypothetical protein